ncbi:hypothetical protein NH340_JMT04994 [Sarcoptes scabiei]|nr:hypothetical protein NH340_JMT04994 [Sarcoptes scabiei]
MNQSRLRSLCLFQKFSIKFPKNESIPSRNLSNKIINVLSKQNENSDQTKISSKSSSQDLFELSSEEINRRLMSFFDEEKNWNKDEVITGRSWRLEELRIKSNSDLHKLWYVLVKERNMLYTMQQAAKDEVENMSSPERIVKVEDSMKNIEEVIKERNRAYFKLEVGPADIAERRRVFRRDIFGRWRWIGCSEHLIPYWMNAEWRKFNSPGHGPDVQDFLQRLREIKLNKEMSRNLKQQLYCQELFRRFPDLDVDYLQRRFPRVDVQHIKENLDEYVKKYPTKRFPNSSYVQSNKI